MNPLKLPILTVKWLLVAGLIFLALLTYQRYFSPPSLRFTLSPTTVVQKIQTLGRLETTSFTIEKIIEASTQDNAFKDFLFGDRILLIAHGEIIAGVDLSQITEADIQISNKAITLSLPKPEILVTRLDNEQTRVYDRKLGILTKGDKNLEAEARKQAEAAIRQAACQANILDHASQNAKKQLSSLLELLGFNSVTINIPEGKCQ